MEHNVQEPEIKKGNKNEQVFLATHHPTNSAGLSAFIRVADTN